MVAVVVSRRVCSGGPAGRLTWWVRSAQGWEVEEWLCQVEWREWLRGGRNRGRGVVQHFHSDVLAEGWE